jgi:FAD/FMN-containing dehydrogenase
MNSRSIKILRIMKNNLQNLQRELIGIEMITEPNQVGKLSLDYYHFSPILQEQLADKRADIIIKPENETEILQVVKTCVKYKIPLTVRGTGTGNYGQCIPLNGGVVLDLSKLEQILWYKPAIARVQTGAKLAEIDKQTRDIGWEIRMTPSTYKTATIGGFIAGGSGGIGSINYGQLHERGNLLAVRVITMEEEPQIIELRGDEVQKVNHAYGVNGIITELEIPLAPAYNWAELIVTFSDFITAAKFGHDLANSDGIIKKLISIHPHPIPTYFTALKNYISEGEHCALLMIAETSLENLEDLIKQYKGKITYQKTAKAASKGISLGEFSWNHTTLHARSVDPNLTYLQTLLPPDHDLELLKHLSEYFRDELMFHLEFLRVHGTARIAALQLVKYTTETRLNEIIKYHENQGAIIFNPHTYILEDGGMKTINLAQLQFKEMVDPYGLLNQGKMRAWFEKYPV